MKRTLTALLAAAGVVSFAGIAFADCSFHTVQSSTPKPVVTADSEQSTPVTTTTETAEN